jgi:3-hydroxyacyl-[acyl-carrier-protein] dehydratase
VSELSLDPTHWLPHRPPFLLLDALLAIEPGVRASAQWTLRGDEWFFPGHFPGRPTTPGVLLLESIAQCGAVAVLSDPRYAGRLPLFGGVENARFRRQVLPGDTVRLECEMTKLSARGGKGFGRATVDGQVAAETELFFILADAPVTDD